MKNVTVDGGGKPGQGMMIDVAQGHLTLNLSAIYIGANATATISSSLICNNTSKLYDGGIYNNGTLTIDSTVIYDNTAPNGSDIANTKTSQFQIDSLDDVRALYEARNSVPKEWALDSNNPDSSFDTTSATSLKKLVCEIKGEEPPSTEKPPSGDDKKDDTSSGGDNSGSGIGSSATNSSTDNSKKDSSKQTDSHNSTTNNYYTYNNPASSTNTGKDSTSGKSSPATNNSTVASTTDTRTQIHLRQKKMPLQRLKKMITQIRTYRCRIILS